MRITRERHVYSLGVSEPVATVTAPCSLTVETCDCFNGQVTEDGQPKARLNFSHVNPATGPIVVEGAEPGDVLRVHIRAIRPEKTGALMTAPGAGALPDRVKGDTRICPIADGHFTFMGVELPLNPMIGVIGVAPAGESVPCGTPGDHGGNMDTIGIREGAILRLPVFVKGAYLGLGDLHAAMGDGEVSVTGLEVFGEVDLDLSLEKGASLPCPLLHDGDEVSFLASAETVDGAIHARFPSCQDVSQCGRGPHAHESLRPCPYFPDRRPPQDRPFRHARISACEVWGCGGVGEMKVGEGEDGLLQLSRMGMGLLDKIVSLGALAEKSISGKCGKVF